MPQLTPQAKKWLPRVGAGILGIFLIIGCVRWAPPFLDILFHYGKTGKLTGAAASQARSLYFTALFQPNSADASGRLGMLLHSRKQPDDAMYWYRRAMSLDSRSFAWPYYAGILSLKEAKDPKTAVTMLQKALAIDDGYVPGKAALAAALRDSGKLSESDDLYIKLIAKHPKASPVWSGWGDALAAEGRWAEAAGAYRMAVQISPTGGAAWYGLAQASEKLGQKDEAARCLHLADRYRRLPLNVADTYMVRLYDDFPTADSLLVDAMRQRRAGALAASTVSLERALQLEPHRKDAEEDLIAVLAEQRRFADVDKMYKAWVTDHPDGYAGHYNYALSMFQQKRWAEARKALDAARKNNPHGAEALNSLGLLEQFEGHEDKALEDFHAAIHENPWLGEAHVNLGALLESKHQSAAAEQEFLLAIRPESQDPDRRLIQILRRYGTSPGRASFLAAARKQAENDQQGALATLLKGIPEVAAPPRPKPTAQ